MKKLNLLFILMTGIIIISCSSDDATSNDVNYSEKKITQITYENLNNQSQFIQNITYDDNNNILEVKNSNNQLLEKYTYNTLNKIVNREFYEYYNVNLDRKETHDIEYNSNGKINEIIATIFNYDLDGNITNEYVYNNTYTHENNKIVRIKDEGFNNKVIEYYYGNNLITGIKVYRNNELKSDMTFSYDSNGNCISGTGPIDEGSLDSTTINIDLNVVYGNEEKNSIFNSFFDISILMSESFHNIRNRLIYEQGNRYAEEVQWYQYNDYVYKETNNNTFDSSGYITSRTLSEFPNYENYGMITYLWE